MTLSRTVRFSIHFSVRIIPAHEKTGVINYGRYSAWQGDLRAYSTLSAARFSDILHRSYRTAARNLLLHRIIVPGMERPVTDFVSIQERMWNVNSFFSNSPKFFRFFCVLRQKSQAGKNHLPGFSQPILNKPRPNRYLYCILCRRQGIFLSCRFGRRACSGKRPPPFPSWPVRSPGCRTTWSGRNRPGSPSFP